MILIMKTDDETLFTYEQNPEKGPEGWSKINPHWKVCNNGKLQSPIDLTNARVSLIHDEAWRREYKPAPAVIMNRGHDVMVKIIFLLDYIFITLTICMHG